MAEEITVEQAKQSITWTKNRILEILNNAPINPLALEKDDQWYFNLNQVLLNAETDLKAALGN